MKEFDDIAVYVDPEYYTEVQSHKNELEQLLQYGAHLAIYADEKAPKERAMLKRPSEELMQESTLNYSS